MLKIIGPFPPPFGGISVHIYRLLPYLVEQGFVFVVYNQYKHEDPDKGVLSTRGSYLWWVRFLLKRSSAVIHFHQFSWFHFPYFLAFSLVNSRRFIITIHNEKLLKAPGIVRRGASLLLKLTCCRRIIVVSKKVERLLSECGVKNVLYLPAYVPAGNHAVAGCSSGKATVFFNIWKVQGEESIKKYGIDLLFGIAESHPQTDFELFVATPDNLDLLKAESERYGLHNLRIRVGENLVEHLPRADIFMRLNRDDAFGVSIQEAMDCGVPAIASDVCVRPSGALLFKSGDMNDLERAFQHALSSPKDELLKGKVDTDYHLQLIDIYKQLLEEK